MSGLLPGERGVLTAIIVGVCFEVSLLQGERGKGAAPVRPALLGWRIDDLLRFLPSKLNERTNPLGEVYKECRVGSWRDDHFSSNSEADF